MRFLHVDRAAYGEIEPKTDTVDVIRETGIASYAIVHHAYVFRRIFFFISETIKSIKIVRWLIKLSDLFIRWLV